MKLEIELNDKVKSGLKKTFFEKVFKKTFEKSGLDFLRAKKISVSLAVISEEEIKDLNRTYRKINSATDVLSFPEYQDRKELAQAGDKDIFLGEIILCYNDIKEYASKKSMNPQRELAKVASHGLLHLLGFRHSEKMFKIQNSVCEKS